MEQSHNAENRHGKIHEEMDHDPQRYVSRSSEKAWYLSRSTGCIDAWIKLHFVGFEIHEKKRSTDRCTFMDCLKQGLVLHNCRDYRDGEIHVSRVSRVSRHRVTTQSQSNQHLWCQLM